MSGARLNLTTSSPSKDFRHSLRFLGTSLQSLAGHLDQTYAVARKGGSGYYTRNPRIDPGLEDLLSTMTSAYVMLCHIVDSIEEAEAIVDSYEDSEEDESDVAHARGELFATKKLYLDMVPKIGELETQRLYAYVGGQPIEEYNKHVLHNAQIMKLSSPSGVSEVITDPDVESHFKVRQGEVSYKSQPYQVVDTSWIKDLYTSDLKVPF